MYGTPIDLIDFGSHKSGDLYMPMYMGTCTRDPAVWPETTEALITSVNGYSNSIRILGTPHSKFPTVLSPSFYSSFGILVVV